MRIVSLRIREGERGIAAKMEQANEQTCERQGI